MKSIDRVREYLEQHHITAQVKELDASTRTASLAAQAVNAPLGSIVKSLVFLANDTRAILALVAGDQRADVEKIARIVDAARVRIATGDEVRAHTGFAIGGVPPIAHAEKIETVIDRTLSRFEKVWAAAGAPNALFEIETQKLFELTRGRVADIAQGD
ncbi:MAG: YbaK/EbsC family protein [Chloroflexi bacterium]|nr:YbaK/EbsC family protein [Chloroflexota bacterium]MBI3740531.1 YbaK/EbsC family protein [Chloroflexota bacterium]